LGLSVAIAGGITISAILLIFSIIPNLTDSLSTEVTTRSEIFEVSNALSKTNMNITTIVASSGTDVINFNFTNDGTEKLWNYKDFDLLITYDADISGVKTRVTEKLSYNATAAFQEKMTGSGPPQFARPDSDIDVGNWNDDITNTCPGDGDGSLFDELDEVSSDGCTTAVESAQNPSFPNANFTVSLTNPPDPNDDSGHIIEFDARKDGASRTLTLFAELYEGGSLIAQTGTLTLTQTFQTETYPLTVIEAQQIGNYDNLNLRFIADNPDGGPPNRMLLSWAQLELPGIGTIVNLPGLQSKEWTVNLIKNDNLDPHIVNTQENAHIVAQLSYPIFSNGLLKISITSDNGREENDSTTVL